MKRSLLVLTLSASICLPAVAASLGTNARAAIPNAVQQIISVDYRAMRNSETAMALKARVLPENLKQFETALRSMGIAENDVDQLTFASFRSKAGVHAIGLAQGTFAIKQFNLKMKQRKIKGDKYRLATLWPTGTGMVMTFLDDNTMLFGELASVREGLDARDGEAEGLNANSQMTDMMSGVESGSVWSVLDQLGTQNMMRSALGEAAQLGDYEVIKKRLLGSRYTIDFARGVNFNLNVLTSDTMTAATLSSLIKAGMLYKKMNATPVEKTALDGMNVDSDSGKLIINFRTDDNKFQSLLKSEMFGAVVK